MSTKKLQIINSITTQPDWNQNDPNAADYIKNRTHWEEGGYILPETTIALNPVYGAMGSLPFASDPVNGNTYDVTYNGKSYSVVAQITYGCVFNTSDFMIMYMGNNMGQIQTFDGSATATISISGDVDGTYSELLAEMTVSLQAGGISAGTIAEPFNGEIAADITYDVSCNGTLYGATLKASPIGSYLSDADSIVYVDLPTGGILPRFQIKGDVAEATISIYHGTIYKIDAKYLPDINTNLVNGSVAGSLRTIGSAEESDDYTIGENAFAQGKLTIASGPRSHAEGYNATASGNQSHAEGYSTTASGGNSHAEGINTTASGNNSHAEGCDTIACYDYTHVEGWGTETNSRSQHVEGEYNVVNGGYPTVTGGRGTYVHIVGNGTSDTARSNAHAIDWDGNAYYAGDVYVQGDGTAPYFNGAKKLATEEVATTSKAGLMSATDKSKLNGIEAGAQVNVTPDWNQSDETAADYVKNRTHWVEDTRTTLIDDVTINYTSSTGHGITFDSFTEGQTYTVTWDGTDYECVAYTVAGPSVPGIGNNKFVGGGADTGEPFLFFVHSSTSYIYTSTSGTHTFSIAFGSTVVHQLDEKYIPEAKNSNIVNGSAAGSIRTIGSAEESDSYTMGDYAFAEGYGTIASGNYSHAEGDSTTAKGAWCHAEGFGTTAKNVSSHAEGQETTASGNWSHAENCATTASGDASHAEGRYTIAAGDSQHVQGKYNIEDSSNTYAHIVGNGYYSNGTRVYSNAHTLDWDGNAWYAGSVEGTGIILASSTSGSTKRFKLTVDDSGTLNIAEITA